MNFISVKDSISVYGDGAHDDTKALQECIDKLKDGGTVYFPDGTYLLSGALIFYSNQHLIFSDKATLLRSAAEGKLTRYLLASFSEPQWGGYTGTHDVIITGGIFDGNGDMDEKCTLVNTVHCNNIIIENCRFVHCARWHFIEINGTTNTTIRNCVFDGPTYTHKPEELLNEQIQLDYSRHGSYGPVYNCDGELIDFCSDDTVCSNITIENNIFKCDGFPAIGHHGDCTHHNITIRNNIFDGFSGRYGRSRGYIIFRPEVYNISVTDNVFHAPEEKYDSPNAGMVIENNKENVFSEENNIYIGHFTEIVVRGDNRY
ncbi:MAG: hypothetical protein IJA39_03945 [Clostridia bacterium]|nr:hypothetical protein [Clostridia bacterium]